ncbi:glycosyltransferase, partial [Candidatus Micrarchaeota archaeon]|nr:glycosyltransferase [Candidatus Micrarchaeota archaeon]
GKVINQLNEISDKKWTIYVVDGGSKDRTVQIAMEKGAKIIPFGKRGKGLAVKEAFEFLNSEKLVMLDSDLTYPVDKIPEFINMLDSFDVVIGSRFNGTMEAGAMTSINKIGNKLITSFANILYSKNISDVCTGMWGFTKSTYKKINVDAKHFDIEVNIFTEINRLKLKCIEIPITYKRRNGTSSLNPLHGFDIIWFLLKKRF